MDKKTRTNGPHNQSLIGKEQATDDEINLKFVEHVYIFNIAH